MSAPVRADVAIVGAGFGGLGAALALVERGANVVLCETLAYPGGCASTFQRRGARFESGATLFSGFAPEQLFARWIAAHGLAVHVDFLDPVVTLRTPRFELPIPSERARFVELLADRAGARATAVRALFAEQGHVADALWELFDDPSLLPPFGAAAFARHVARVPKYLPLLRWIGRPLHTLVERHGLADFEPLTTFLDAVSQITVQASAREAEAPFAMATMDYYFRGTGHVRGGIGVLAHALVSAIRARGGTVRLADRVRALRRTGDVWTLDARQGPVEARTVVANLLPQSLRKMLPEGVASEPKLTELARAVESGWGAVMLYLVVEPHAIGTEHAHHLELVADPGAPLTEGNHLFCSISDASEARAEGGGRTVTISTHVPLVARADEGAYVARIQERMRATLRLLAPELVDGMRSEMTASPRTFARFTGRHLGFVGGIPRRVGLGNYLRHLGPARVAPSLYLVGDTVFPGQSTLATAIGGVKLAEHLRSR